MEGVHWFWSVSHDLQRYTIFNIRREIARIRCRFFERHKLHPWLQRLLLVFSCFNITYYNSRKNSYSYSHFVDRFVCFRSMLQHFRFPPPTIGSSSSRPTTFQMPTQPHDQAPPPRPGYRRVAYGVPYGDDTNNGQTTNGIPPNLTNRMSFPGLDGGGMTPNMVGSPMGRHEDGGWTDQDMAQYAGQLSSQGKSPWEVREEMQSTLRGERRGGRSGF